MATNPLQETTPKKKPANPIPWLVLSAAVLAILFFASQNNAASPGSQPANRPAGPAVTYDDLCPSNANRMTGAQWKAHKQKYIGATANRWTVSVSDVSSDNKVRSTLDARGFLNDVTFDVSASDATRLYKGQQLEITGVVKKIEDVFFGNGCSGVVLESVTWK